MILKMEAFSCTGGRAENQDGMLLRVGRNSAVSETAAEAVSACFPNAGPSGPARREGMVRIPRTEEDGEEYRELKCTVHLNRDQLPVTAAVFDGVGGSEYGRLASACAAEAAACGPPQIREMFENANTAIRAAVTEHAPGATAFTTATAVRLTCQPWGESMLLSAQTAALGDSPAYLIRDGKAVRLGENQNAGWLSGKLGRKLDGPRRGIVFYLGGELRDPYAAASKHHLLLREGDVILLATDGLADVLPLSKVGRYFSSEDPLSELMRDRLYASQRRFRQTDNITVIRLTIMEEDT